jgi:chromosome segregation ATPase
MSRIWGIVVGLCAIVGVGAIVFHFSGARGDVAKKKVLGQIDKWLGESEIQRAEIERGIKGLNEAVGKLNEASVKSRVQADRLSRELKVNKAKIEESKVSLKRLGDDLKKFDTESKYSVSYGTKTYTKKDDLEKMANTVIDYHKSLVAQTDTMEKRLETYESTAATLETRTNDAKKKLVEMKNQLKEIDNKIELAKAQREAAEALSETDKSFADSVKGIEENIKNLDISTETAVRVEDAKWKDLTAKTEVEDASAIINKTKSTSSEIDALLGNK